MIVTECVDYRLQHEWTVSPGSCVDDDARASGFISLKQLIGVDTPTVFIPRRALHYGAYCVRFRSCFYRAPGCSNASVDLEVRESPLRAVIAGGDERLVVVSETIVFDGSFSYDPDSDDNAERRSFLTYNWTCQVVCSNNSVLAFIKNNGRIAFTFTLCLMSRPVVVLEGTCIGLSDKIRSKHARIC